MSDAFCNVAPPCPPDLDSARTAKVVRRTVLQAARSYARRTVARGGPATETSLFPNATMVFSGKRWWWFRRFGVALLLACGVIVMFSLLENFLVYPGWALPIDGDWSPVGISREDVEFTSADGTQLHGWYLAHPRPVAHLLFCHGNGENVAHLAGYLDEMREDLAVSIFAFDYRGYGKSEGRPFEKGVLEDGSAAHHWLARRAGISPGDVVLMGRSLGAAVAVDAAARNGARALVLESAFPSLPDVAARHYAFLPVRTFMRNRYESQARIQAFSGPLLQSHGTADQIVPIELGRALFDAAPCQPKHFISLPDTGHNDPPPASYYHELRKFLHSLPELERDGDE